MPTATNKQENEKTKLEVIELLTLERKYKNVTNQYQTKKQKLSTSIKNFMYANNCGNFSFDLPKGYFEQEGKLVVQKRQAKKVVWNVEKMAEKFDAELLNEITTKSYRINDIDGLVRYLKKCGVNPKKFKGFIEVERSVDKKRLDYLFETGELKMADLEGCYELKESESYLKLDIVEE